MHYSLNQPLSETEISRHAFDNLTNVVHELEYMKKNILSSNKSESDSMIRRFREIGTMLTPYFPTIAKRFSTTEPVVAAKIPLPAGEKLLSFDTYRELNAYYDDCLRADYENNNTTESPFENTLIFCRLKNKVEGIKNYSIIDFLRHLSQLDYHQFLIDAQPKQADIIKRCAYLNGNCTISDVQTSIGRCYRIAPKNQTEAVITTSGSRSSVDVVLDLYSFGSKDTTALILFRPINETEFALNDGGIEVKPGEKTTLEISQMRELSRVETHCGERALEHFSTYSRQNCQWNGNIEAVKQNCGCLPAVHPISSKFSSTPFCSLSQTFSCARFQIVENPDCPDDCESTTHDIDINSVSITYKDIRGFLPEDWRMKRSCIACNFLFYYDKITTPGARHYEYLINELFQFHLNMTKMFWWKSHEQSYLRTFLYNTTSFWKPQLFPSTSHYDEYFSGDYPVPCAHQHLSKANISSEDLKIIMDILNPILLPIDENGTKARWFTPWITYKNWLATSTMTNEFMDQPSNINFPAISVIFTTGATGHLELLDHVLFNLSYQIAALENDLSTIILNMNFLSKSADSLLKSSKAKSVLSNVLTCLTSLQHNVSQLKQSSVLPGSDVSGIFGRWLLDFQDFVDHYLTMYSNGRGYDESNLAQVQTYYRSFRRHVTTEEHAYSVWSLLSDIGGALGLWIGATVVTAFEIIVVLVNPQRFLNSRSSPRKGGGK